MQATVDIMERQEDGSEKRIATFRLKDGELECDNGVLWKHLMNSAGGVVIGARGKRFYPRDGVEYLKNLKFHFAGPYLFARPVEELPDAPAVATSPYVTLGEPRVQPPAPPQPPPPPPAPVEDPAAQARGRTSRPATRPSSSRGTPGSNTPESRASRPPEEPALPREVQEQLCSAVFRLSSCLRGLAFPAAQEAAGGLLKRLSELVKVDFNAMRRAFESREEYLELRYQPPSRLNYAKVWERLQRSWQNFLEVLERGELAESLWPLFLVREGLAALPEHRAEWLQSTALSPGWSQESTGTSASELSRGWELAGMPLLRRHGFSAAMVDEAYAQAQEPLERAAGLLAQAALGKAEEELRAALRLDPGLVEGRLLLGDLLRRRDRVPEALCELQLVMELEHLWSRPAWRRGARAGSPLRVVRARAGIARTLLSQGRVRETIDQLDKALETLDLLSRRTPAESLLETEQAQLREEELAIHRLLEPLFRSIGEQERAEHHRKKAGS